MQVPWPASQAPSKAAGMGSREARERQPVWGAEDCALYPCYRDTVQKEGTQGKEETGKAMRGQRGKKEAREKAATGQEGHVSGRLNAGEVCPCRKLWEDQEQSQPQARGITLSPLKEGCPS